MTLRDIVNRDNVNLANCESEPIHIPGSIQPHGLLLALDEGSLQIVFCSNNTADYLGLTPQQLLGKKPGDIFDEAEAAAFEKYIAMPAMDAAHPYVFTYRDIRYNTAVHKSSGKIVLELEPFPDGSLALPNLYTQTRTFVQLMENAGSLQQLCAAIADETRAITGYDRVMIYRFDKDYNGEIFAESRRADLQPFLGLNYPHTDIPAQARELYLHNLMRMIVDVRYEPVPILAIDSNSTNKDLDLSHSVLRSVSPIHIEYLKNMGVGATLTISLIQDKKLWGLIACHHYSPKNIPHYTRLAALLQGHFLTSQLEVREAADEYDLKIKTEHDLQGLLDQLTTSADLEIKGFESPLLLKITNAAGVAVLHDDRLYTSGHTPPEDELRKLAAWLHQHIKSGVLHASKLIDVYPHAAAVSETAAGIIYHSLGKPQDCIIWFRPEVEKTINWAGDPAKAMIRGNNNVHLSPRKSFELWKEIVRYQSREWRPAELQAAESLAFFLQRQYNLISSMREEVKYRQLSEKLQVANEELANINWISIHDLKEPLRKMQIFASRVLENERESLSPAVTDSVKRIQQSAARMQMLIDDLLAYSRITNHKSQYSFIDLNAVVNELNTDFSEEIVEKNAIVTATTHLPVVCAIPFQVRQLFSNLVSNALKFSRENVVPRVEISSEIVRAGSAQPHFSPDKDYYKVVVKDNGIGFDNNYNIKIFDVFKRLHSPAKYNGTGIGLAICKKIMDNHDGFIEAHGRENEGATFTLYFPLAIDKQ